MVPHTVSPVLDEASSYLSGQSNSPTTKVKPITKIARRPVIVPAIPRALERRRSANGSSANLSGKQNVPVSVLVDITPVEETCNGVSEQSGEVQDAGQVNGLDSLGETRQGEPYTVAQAVAEPEREQTPEQPEPDLTTITSPTLPMYNDFGIERHGHQLPPAFYPAASTQSSLTHAEDLEHSVGVGSDIPINDPDAVQQPPLARVVTTMPDTISYEPSFSPMSPITTSIPTYHGYTHAPQYNWVTTPYQHAQPYPPQPQPSFPPYLYRYPPPSAAGPHMVSAPFAFHKSDKPITPSTTPSDNQSRHLPRSAPTADMDDPEMQYYANGLRQRQDYHDNSPNNTINEATRVNRVETRSLVPYLIEQFNTAEYSDCILDIQGPDFCLSIQVHALIIGQSQVLRRMMDTANFLPETGKKNMLLHMSNLTAAATPTMAALRVLYGQSSDAFLHDLDLQTHQKDHIDSVLAYHYAGLKFDVPEVVTVATYELIRLFAIEDLDQLVSYAISLTHLPSFFTTSTPETETHRDPSQMSVSPDHYPAATAQLLHSLMSQFAERFPSSFILDCTAPSLRRYGAPVDDLEKPIVVAMADSFTESLNGAISPSTPEATRKRLSSIRFGDFSPEDEEKVGGGEPSNSSSVSGNGESGSATDRVISSILLSLPPSHLQVFFEYCSPGIFDLLSPPLQEERERRLVSAMKNAEGRSIE
ncbi:hypothetical protein MMC25_000257 [Agyrium rufum]|nr:hypothetical protein [Agyrium rufum]